MNKMANVTLRLTTPPATMHLTCVVQGKVKCMLHNGQVLVENSFYTNTKELKQMLGHHMLRDLLKYRELHCRVPLQSLGYDECDYLE